MTWLDDRLADLRADDERMSSLLNAFTLLAVIVSNLGILGLAALTVALRRKEIGVRKVLGAGRFDLVFLLSRDFLLLVAIAFIIAIPLTWFGLQQWLHDFAFRIEIGPAHVLIALLFVAAPSVFVVVTQALRSSRVDPVHCLRSD